MRKRKNGIGLIAVIKNIDLSNESLFFFPFPDLFFSSSAKHFTCSLLKYVVKIDPVRLTLHWRYLYMATESKMVATTFIFQFKISKMIILKKKIGTIYFLKIQNGRQIKIVVF
jgi:hypothetical protein